MVHEAITPYKDVAQEWRKRSISTIIPYVRKAFETYPQLRSSMLLIAQYWIDDATDAVQSDMFFSELETPDWDAYYLNQDGPHPAPDKVNFPTLKMEPKRFIEQFEEEHGHMPWNENYAAIPAFAAFCKNGGSQNNTVQDNYIPYAIFRKLGKEVAVEVVGVMLRPWLDGVRPDSEGGALKNPTPYVEQAATMREHLFSEKILPVMQRAFADNPSIKSAIITVSQYPDELAEDAVHLSLFYSEKQEATFDNAEELKDYQVENWPRNTMAIPAFACFVHREGRGIFYPYAICRRMEGGTVDLRESRMHRPWVEGCQPSLERADGIPLLKS